MTFPTITLTPPKNQMNKMIEYLQIQPPIIEENYTPHGTRCQISVDIKTPSSPDNDTTTKLFFGPTDTPYEKSEEAACRQVMQFLRDYYPTNITFQVFILVEIYSTDPFLMEQLISDTSSKYTQLEKELATLKKDYRSASIKLQMNREEQRHTELMENTDEEEMYRRLITEIQQIRMKNRHLRAKNKRKKTAIKKAIQTLSSPNS